MMMGSVMMLLEERKNKIMNLLKVNGKVTSKELSEQLHVSEVTIRSDLKRLEAEQLLKRVHGGAIKMKPELFDPRFQEQIAVDKEEKREIGKKAISFVDKNDVIFVDAGSSTLFFVEELVKAPPLNITVVTNSLYVINEIVQYGDIRLIVLGGMFYKKSLNFLDLDMSPLLTKYNVNQIFLGVNGLDEKGIYSTSNIEARINKELYSTNAEIFILASSSKFFKRSLILINEWQGREKIITSDQNKNENERLNILKQEKSLEIF